MNDYTNASVGGAMLTILRAPRKVRRWSVLAFSGAWKSQISLSANGLESEETPGFAVFLCLGEKIPDSFKGLGANFRKYS